MPQFRIAGAVFGRQDFSRAALTRSPGQLGDIGQYVLGRSGGGVRLWAVPDRAGLKGHVRPERVIQSPARRHIHAFRSMTLESGDGTRSAGRPLAAVQDAIIACRLGKRPLPARKGRPFRFFLPKFEECAVSELDACAKVKCLALLRLSQKPGRDVRPSGPASHHERPGHRHLPDDRATPPPAAKAGVVAIRPTATAEPEVLLITSRKHPRSWIFPVGSVEPGESLERAAGRECAEESGYTVEVGQLLAELALPDEADRTVQRFFFFAARPTGECSTYETDRQRRWVPLSELQSVIAPVFIQVAQAAVQAFSRLDRSSR